MDYLGTIILITLLGDMGLGLAVYFSNRQRPANQQYLVFTIIIGLWLACIGGAMISMSEAAAVTLIRQSHVMAALIITGFNFLRLAILDPGSRPLTVWWKSRYWLLGNLGCTVLCNTSFFLHGVTLPSSLVEIPEPLFGPGFPLFGAYFLGSCILTIGLFIRDTRRVQGIQRAELQFVMLAGATGLTLGSLLGILIPLVSGSSQVTQFTPLATVVAHTIIAYGIGTTRIMEVAQLLQRSTVFAAVLCTLVAVYTASLWVLEHLQIVVPLLRGEVPSIAAAIVTALSIQPARQLVDRLSQALFAHTPLIDFSKTMRQAGHMLQSIATLDDLLQDFTELITQAVDALHIRIYLYEEGAYVLAHSSLPADKAPPLSSGDTVVRILRDSINPLSLDDIHRLKKNHPQSEAGKRMMELDAHLGLGIRGKEHLEGVMLLGPRVSGRIYGAPEQDRLQFLSNQFAVAVENARLYTQVQDSKIYNDILVDNIVSGVIAVNAARNVTVFNREAQRITRLSTSKVLYQPLHTLPRVLGDILADALVRSERTREHEVTLVHDGGDEIPLRVGSAAFHSHTGQALGAMVVLSDLSNLKKLEQQVRRTDRLASIGTLAAGMAHEIKNPLVAVKTFTQLLPERYDDEEFRDTFSSLIGEEVQRIDSIVNQMLDFARPAKPDLAPVHLHQQVEGMVKLIGQQMKSRSIDLQMHLGAEEDLIQADANLLRQALVNLLLNALDAMAEGGTLSIRTHLETSTLPGDIRPSTRIRLSIEDTGQGIPSDYIGQVFDPFFTTKDRGTGLGLSVSHGIIVDHGGTIDVESDHGVGTVFHVGLPLLRKEVPA